MPKSIASPIKRWPGTVTLSDPLTYSQVFSWEDALAAVQALEQPTQARLNAALLPAILACVEQWQLERFPTAPTAGNFPATPAQSAARLIAWLIQEISSLYREADEIPNA